MGLPRPVAVRTEITSVEDLETLVRRFYQAVIPDPQLGPIFHDFGVDWAEHIPKLVDFWCLRLFDRPGYQGNAVGAHQPVLEKCPFGPAELARWLELWEETVDELFVGDVATSAKERAHMAGEAIASLVRRHERSERSTLRVKQIFLGGVGGQLEGAVVRDSGLIRSSESHE